jgi:pyrimidine and pyridine-specific 5'-nucleotidase
MDFNAKVDDALPLEDILKPDPKLRRLLEDIDKQKVKLWLFTNAYVTHGKRVVKLLGVDDLFEGITYCDYGAKEGIVAKPRIAMFQKAMTDAGADSVDECFFVGKI